MAKKTKVEFEDMSKEELIKKCYTYKDNLFIANQKIKSLNSELEIIRVVLSTRNIPNKLRICMDETLSYIEEVERMKIKERKEKMKPEFEIDDNVIIVDYVDDQPVYIDDFVIQIIISKDDIEYLFENVSRPVSIHSKRLFKYSYNKEQELKNNGYVRTCSLI